MATTLGVVPQEVGRNCLSLFARRYNRLLHSRVSLAMNDPSVRLAAEDKCKMTASDPQRRASHFAAQMVYRHLGRIARASDTSCSAIRGPFGNLLFLSGDVDLQK